MLVFSVSLTSVACLDSTCLPSSRLFSLWYLAGLPGLPACLPGSGSECVTAAVMNSSSAVSLRPFLRICASSPTENSDLLGHEGDESSTKKRGSAPCAARPLFLGPAMIRGSALRIVAVVLEPSRSTPAGLAISSYPGQAAPALLLGPSIPRSRVTTSAGFLKSALPTGLAVATRAAARRKKSKRRGFVRRPRVDRQNHKVRVLYGTL